MKREKIIRPGKIQGHPVFCKITYENKVKDEDRLSISGVVGPRRSGNAWGDCGQIDMNWRGKNATNPQVDFAKGWNQKMFDTFLDMWQRWHLNDMKAGCEHQRAGNWTHCPGHYSKPGINADRVNQELRESGVGLVRGNGRHYYCTDDDAPKDGEKCASNPSAPVVKLCTPCPVCGYKYASAWLHESVPQEVIDFLFSLPNSDEIPAWV